MIFRLFRLFFFFLFCRCDYFFSIYSSLYIVQYKPFIYLLLFFFPSTPRHSLYYVFFHNRLLILSTNIIMVLKRVPFTACRRQRYARYTISIRKKKKIFKKIIFSSAFYQFSDEPILRPGSVHFPSYTRARAVNLFSVETIKL